MKKLSLFAAILAMLIFSGCSETATTPTSTVKTCFVQKVLYSDSSSYTYTYDASNRVSSNTFIQDTRVSKTDYNNNGKTVLATSNGMLVQTYYLNNKGFADSLLTDIQGFYLKEINTYNSEGLKINTVSKSKYMNTNMTDTTTYQYVNGNLSKEIFSDGNYTLITDFEYYTDKINYSKKSNEAQDFTNDNVNLRKKATTNSGNVTNYAYEFDADGKVLKQITTFSGGDISSKTFTWICK